MKEALEVSLGSLRLKTPLMPASGTFGYGDEYVRVIPYDGIGAIVTKSLSLLPREGNPPPRVHELDTGLLNSIGLENMGVMRFLSEKLPSLSVLGLPIVVSVFGETEEEFLQVVERLQGHEVIKAIELNLSCPNVKKGGTAFGTDPKSVYKLVNSTRKATSLDIWAKLPPDPFHIVEIAKAAEEGGADALTLSNTLPAMAVDVEAMKPLLGGVTGGISGKAVREIGLRIVYEVKKAVSVPLIASGGISSTEDALAFIMVGASALQLGTALFSNPLVFREISEGLLDFLKRKGISHIGELKGSIHAVVFPSLS